MRTRRLVVTLLIVCVAFASADSTYAAPNGDGKLTPETALTKAIAIMGLDKDTTWKRPSESKAVTTLTITDDDTPFLHEEINGREALKVRLERVPVVARDQRTDTTVMGAFRNFDVYLDATTGQLVKIVSALDSYENKVESGEIRFPSVEVAEEQIKSMNETYEGLSSEIPAVGYLTAFAHADGNPVGSDLVVAQLLNVRVGSRYHRPAWVVNTHGKQSIVPSIPFGTNWPTHQPYELNHLRTVLDTTGKFLYATNVPYATR
jgi:hypothetical protein